VARARLTRVASFGAYQASWWACVLGAGTSWAIAGITGTLAYAAWHLGTTQDRARELRIVLTATAVGALFDSALVLAGAMSFAPAVQLGPLPSPLWLVALWTGFGATLTSSFGFTLAGPVRAAAFGACAGPLAYFGGSRLVAMELGNPTWTSLLGIGLAWALAMLLLWRAARVEEEPVPMKKMLPLAALLVFVTSCATPGDTVANDDLEKPRYTVIEDATRFELRRYEPYIVAATVVKGDFDKASNAGFRILAGYIFGGNQPATSIAMTAPVSVAKTPEQGERIAMTAPVSATSQGDSWRITFMMPSKYSLETLPEPTDARVMFEEQPARCVASVRFAGFTTRAAIEKQTAALRGWLAEQGLPSTGAASVERYNDPFTLPWNRRNEVHIPLPAEACPAPRAQADAA
jgi:hypothetical protein